MAKLLSGKAFTVVNETISKAIDYRVTLNNLQEEDS